VRQFESQTLFFVLRAVLSSAVILKSAQLRIPISLEGAQTSCRLSEGSGTVRPL